MEQMMRGARRLMKSNSVWHEYGNQGEEMFTRGQHENNMIITDE